MGEKGFTKIPNDLLDALCRFPIGHRQRQVLDFIMRKTLGYQKKSVEIPRYEFLDATGIEEKNLNRPIKALAQRNMISVHKGEGKRWTTYGINLNVSSWKTKRGKSLQFIVNKKRSIYKINIFIWFFEINTRWNNFVF